MNRVDVTLSVLIEKAFLEYERTTDEIMRNLKLPIDLIECALEKEIMEIKNKKIAIYSGTILDMYTSSIKENEKTGE